MVAVLSSGPYGGIQAPVPKSGQYVFPFPHTESPSGPLAIGLNANTAYYVPFPIFGTTSTSYSGAYIYMNSTAAASNARLCLAAESATGGPGALLKDFGSISISTAGLYGFTSTLIAPAGPRMCYLGIVFDSTPVLRAMQPAHFYTAAGVATPTPAAAAMPRFNSPGSGSQTGWQQPVGYSGAFTFGAWTDPVPVPTADILAGASGTSGQMPLITLKVT